MPHQSRDVLRNDKRDEGASLRVARGCEGVKRTLWSVWVVGERSVGL